MDNANPITTQEYAVFYGASGSLLPEAYEYCQGSAQAAALAGQFRGGGYWAIAVPTNSTWAETIIEWLASGVGEQEAEACTVLALAPL